MAAVNGFTAIVSAFLDRLQQRKDKISNVASRGDVNSQDQVCSLPAYRARIRKLY